MQVTIRIHSAHNQQPILCDCVRLLFNGSECYIESNGRFVPLTKQKIKLNPSFFLDLELQEQKKGSTKEAVKFEENKNSSDPLAFLFDSSLLIHQARYYSHRLID